jgi:hypothetical protein
MLYTRRPARAGLRRSSRAACPSIWPTTSRLIRGSLTPLHLDDHRDRILIEEQLVDAPAVPVTALRRNAGLTRHNQPTPRRVGIHLVAGEQIRVTLEQLLKIDLKLLGLLDHLDQLFTTSQEDPTSHAPTQAAAATFTTIRVRTRSSLGSGWGRSELAQASASLMDEARPSGLLEKRMMGLEPTTFCMASGSWETFESAGCRMTRGNPALSPLFRSRRGFSQFPAHSGQSGHYARIGVQCMVRASTDAGGGSPDNSERQIPCTLSFAQEAIRFPLPGSSQQPRPGPISLDDMARTIGRLLFNQSLRQRRW